MSGTLYVVATPIGNLEEISLRAVRILSQVDVIAAEDTRTTGLMLSRLSANNMMDKEKTRVEILENETKEANVSNKTKKPKLFSHHKFNEAASLGGLLNILLEGKNVALLSDAGTPCISDPGHMLVNAAAEQGIDVVGIGGSCAVTMALSVSGFPAEPFLFLGFIPRKDVERLAVLERWFLLNNVATLIFYESPKRMTATIECFVKHFPETALCLCNDLTKKFERIYRGTPSEVLENLQANPFSEKGEYTCVAYMPEHKRQTNRTAVSVLEDFCHLSHKSQESHSLQSLHESQNLSLESLLVDTMVKTGYSLKEAISFVSKNSAKYSNVADFPKKNGITKKELYAASLRLKGLF